MRGDRKSMMALGAIAALGMMGGGMSGIEIRARPRDVDDYPYREPAGKPGMEDIEPIVINEPEPPISRQRRRWLERRGRA